MSESFLNLNLNASPMSVTAFERDKAMHVYRIVAVGTPSVDSKRLAAELLLQTARIGGATRRKRARRSVMPFTSKNYGRDEGRSYN